MGLLSRLGLGSGSGPARERAALGQRGVWRRAHDRFRRAVDRYHQVIEGVPDGAVRDRLEADGARLAAALDAVRATCVAAHAVCPSEGLDVPGGRVDGVDLRDLHRDLSRAAGLAAQAAEAAAMVRVLPAGQHAAAAGAEPALAAVSRAVERAAGSVPAPPRAGPGTGAG